VVRFCDNPWSDASATASICDRSMEVPAFEPFDIAVVVAPASGLACVSVLASTAPKGDPVVCFCDDSGFVVSAVVDLMAMRTP